MFNIRKFLFILACLCFAISMSCVCAGETENICNEFNDERYDDDLEINTQAKFGQSVMNSSFDFNSISYENINSAPGGSVRPYTIDALNYDLHQLNPGDTFTFDRDYIYDSDILRYGGVVVNVDNITINGNGHTIDGNSIGSIFIINANNVKIFNLTIFNSHQLSFPDQININLNGQSWIHSHVDSPITWNGDNGVISNCNFLDNQAVKGGVITWCGNNGLIEKCIFLNNFARGAGGSIYIGGENNTIANSIFCNSTSILSGEAIFADRSRKNLTLLNLSYNKQLFIDGKKSNFDVNYLYYTAVSTLINYDIDLVDMVYLSLVHNQSAFYVDEDTFFYGGFNDTTFTLTFNKCFGDDIYLIKEYQFSNMTCQDNVFSSIFNSNFDVDYIFIKDMTIAGEIVGPAIGNTTKDYSYDDVRTMTIIEAFLPIYQYLLNDSDINANAFAESLLFLNNTMDNAVFVLNVNFARPMTINNKNTWYSNGFDTIIINGNHSFISGGSDTDDEFKWASITPNHNFIVSDLTIGYFNTAIENMGGYCVFNNVIFSENKMDYWFDRDWGAAILNTGIFVCNNCSFLGNYAKNGGAIFNQGVLTLLNCVFDGNLAYGEGNNVCVGDNGMVIIDGNQITSDNSIVTFVESMSTEDIDFCTAICLLASFTIGVVAGAIAGPVAGVIVGAVMGGILGSVFAGEVIEHSYDVNFNRLKIGLIFIGGSVALGIIGGVIGGLFHLAYNAPVPEEPVPPIYQYMAGDEITRVTAPEMYQYIAETHADDLLSYVADSVMSVSQVSLVA